MVYIIEIFYDLVTDTAKNELTSWWDNFWEWDSESNNDSASTLSKLINIKLIIDEIKTICYNLSGINE